MRLFKKYLKYESKATRFRANFLVYFKNERKNFMFGFKFLGNTRIPHNKNTAEMKPVKMTPPKEVLLSMQQHIGAPATPIVKVGEEVKVGQLIAEPSGYVSSPVYASVSIFTSNSGLADALSTALFCMSYEEGLSVVQSIGGVDVLWIYKDGTMKMTDGVAIIG